MPTKKKRVGFIPREDVMRIIDKLSIENNLSTSKIIGFLVEEALSVRGIFNKKNARVTESYQLNKGSTQNSSENSDNFIDNSKFLIHTNLGSDYNPNKSDYSKEINQKAFDLQTYKKFLLFLRFQEMLDKYEA